MAEKLFPSSLCNCQVKSFLHVHCRCKDCSGKAVSRRTQLRHIKLQNELLENDGTGEEGNLSLDSSFDSEYSIRSFDNIEDGIGNPTASFSEDQTTIDVEATGYHEGLNVSNYRCDEDVQVANDPTACLTEDQTSIAVEMRDDDEGVSTVSNDLSDNQVPAIVTKNAIVLAIFESVSLASKMNASLNNFADLLKMAKTFYCKGAQLDLGDPEIAGWPTNWSEAKRFLTEMGYEDAKEYFVCLSDKHPCHWDILDTKKDVCKYCGQNGTIPYYYLGLEAKVKLWVSDKSMCYNITGHWREKEHWLGRSESWPLKKEIWDGSRFANLSWFFDPNSRWPLPVRCQCNNIISGEQVESLPEIAPGLKEVLCDVCRNTFRFQPKFVSGDPRNIALIGHWDGFQPFGMNSRSTGAIEVTVATMSKANRCKDQETYTIGFVPSYLLPDSRPNSLDPFLEPLICDFETGFIEGFEVDYKGENIECFPAGKMIIRILLLLWTGDHVAQCEVCKSKGAGGKNACRRCKLKAVYLEAQRHYYYPSFREAFRFPYTERDISKELPEMEKIEEEERATVAASMSRESGFMGVSQLHRLHKLYKFDVLKDLVYDVMHLVPLNLVKRRLEHLISNELIDVDELDAALKNIPWTREYKESRLPLSLRDIKYWKASEFQKFAFPAAENVLQDLVDPSDAEVWAPLPRIVESIFNTGVIYGWSTEMTENFHRLCWRYCILVEEAYGITECLITLHSLTHVSEDITRFSSPDNYWCFQYERAVGRYVKQSSNKKCIEKTFARNESQREFIKSWSREDEEDTSASRSGKHDNKKMVATSLQAAQNLVKLCEFSSDASRALLGILIGSGSTIHVLQPQEEQSITRCLNSNGYANATVSQFVTPYRSALRPLQKSVIGGTLYQKGDTALVSQDNNHGHVIVKIQNFYLVSLETQYVPMAIGDLYRTVRDERNNILRHPLSDSIIVEPFQTNFAFHVRDLKRKLMLYPYNQGYALIDPDRTIRLPPVLVPVFPQVGDMALVKGDDDEVWRAEIRLVDQQSKSVKGFFFIKHPGWRNNGLWKRESSKRAFDVIHFKSIVGLAEGEWQGPYWKDS